MKIFKEKLPDRIVFERKNDGIYENMYEVTYTGMAVMNNNEDIFQNTTVTIPRCTIDFDSVLEAYQSVERHPGLFVPVPVITAIGFNIEDSIKFDNNIKK